MFSDTIIFSNLKAMEYHTHNVLCILVYKYEQNKISGTIYCMYLELVERGRVEFLARRPDRVCKVV